MGGTAVDVEPVDALQEQAGHPLGDKRDSRPRRSQQGVGYKLSEHHHRSFILYGDRAKTILFSLVPLQLLSAYSYPHRHSICSSPFVSHMKPFLFTQPQFPVDP